VEAKVRLPAAIVEIIVVKVNRTVLVWSTPEIELVSVPVETGYGARRTVDDRTVDAVATQIKGGISFRVTREVPGSCDGLRSNLIDGLTGRKPGQFSSPKTSCEYTRSVKLAIQMPFNIERTSIIGPARCSGKQKRLTGMRNRRRRD
jgi:hypothetical protein